MGGHFWSRHVNPRGVPWIAWGMCSAAAALGIASIFMVVVDEYPLSEAMEEAAQIAIAITFPLVGALIASTHPRNPIGWTFCLIGCSEGVVEFTYLYAQHVLVLQPGSGVGGKVAVWLGT